MEGLFELPELFTISGERLTEDRSLEDLLTLSECNACFGGSGKCGNGS